MGIQILFIRYGLADTFWGVVLVHLVPALPYFVLVMASVFANYDTAFEETARTLGAGPARVLWHVTLPAIRAGLSRGHLVYLLGVVEPVYYNGSDLEVGKVVTLPMVLFPFISAANHPNAAAVSIVFVLPAIFVLLFTSPRLER